MRYIRPGRTLFLRGPHDRKPHLWVVLTEPEGQSGCFVAVMLRTAKHFTDRTVVLEDGDHPFVTRPTSVDYSMANYFTASFISDALKSGRCHPQADVAPDLLERIRNGLLSSSHTVHAIREYCRGRFQKPPSGCQSSL